MGPSQTIVGGICTQWVNNLLWGQTPPAGEVGHSNAEALKLRGPSKAGTWPPAPGGMRGLRHLHSFSEPLFQEG